MGRTAASAALAVATDVFDGDGLRCECREAAGDADELAAAFAGAPVQHDGLRGRLYHGGVGCGCSFPRAAVGFLACISAEYGETMFIVDKEGSSQDEKHEKKKKKE